MNELLIYEWRGAARRRINFGDLLAQKIVSSIRSERVVVANKNSAEIIAIGSVLNGIGHSFPKAKAIWGSGFIHPTSFEKPEGIEVLAVRGQKTADLLEFEGPLGDPGLLTAKYFEGSAEKNGKIGIIPHYKDKNEELIKLLEQDERFIIIDVEQSPETVVREISSVDLIFSSSLHGLIVADSFEIPNYWIKLTNLVKSAVPGEEIDESEFKFLDYFSGVNRDADKVKFDAEKIISADFEMLKQQWRPVNKLKDIQNNLIEALQHYKHDKKDDAGVFYTDDITRALPKEDYHSVVVFSGSTRLFSSEDEKDVQFISDLMSLGYRCTKILPGRSIFEKRICLKYGMANLKFRLLSRHIMQKNM